MGKYRYIRLLLVISFLTNASIAVNQAIGANPSPKQTSTPFEFCNAALSRILQTREVFEPSAEELDEWLAKDLKAVEAALSKNDILPTSLRQISPLEKTKNEVFFSALKLVSRFIAKRNRTGFINGLGKIMNGIHDSPFSFLVKGSAFTRLRKLLNHPSILKDGERRRLRLT